MFFSSSSYRDRDCATAELSACVLSFTYICICRWLPACARPVESIREKFLGEGIVLLPRRSARSACADFICPEDNGKFTGVKRATFAYFRSWSSVLVPWFHR